MRLYSCCACIGTFAALGCSEPTSTSAVATPSLSGAAGALAVVGGAAGSGGMSVVEASVAGVAGAVGAAGDAAGAGGVPAPASVAGFPASRVPGSLAFDTVRIQDQFWGEGASLGDFDGDGHVDVTNGPWVWAGPDFAARWQFRDYDTGADFFENGEYDPFGMADSWAVYAYDVNSDGRTDVISKGHPGHASALWYENTGQRGKYTPHPMQDDIALEQNLFFDVTGDGRPELVAAKDGHMGFVKADWNAPAKPWTFQGVSEDGPWGNPNNFFHGVGIGDMNADGRIDVLHNTGWDEQPKEGGTWTHHGAAGWPGQTTGAQFGGSHMFGYDIDGDGDTDMVTSLNSHGYGLAWWEQAGSEWKRHLIFGAPGEASEHPDITISQVHAIALADMDGDGLLDVVTGKSYWAHPDASGTPATEDVRGTPYLYVFRLARKPGEMFEPHLVSDESGVGRQFAIGDVNDDGALDIVVGNKLGTFVYTQRR